MSSARCFVKHEPFVEKANKAHMMIYSYHLNLAFSTYFFLGLECFIASRIVFPYFQLCRKPFPTYF